jgi:extradiol dioxygenase family protein
MRAEARRYSPAMRPFHDSFHVLFFHDPSGNAIELKTFRDPAQIFAK